MRDFEYRVVGEIIGQWDGHGPADWILPEGELFFFCQWRLGPERLTWFGIYHEALDYLESFARRSGKRVRHLLRSPLDWYRLEELSTQTPGWGLVYEPAPGSIEIFRDPIGRLPLVWMRAENGVEWGTLASRLPSFRNRPRISTIEKYLHNQCSETTNDFWQGVRRIRAGELLAAAHSSSKGASMRRESWWPGDSPISVKDRNPSQRVGDLLNEEIETIFRVNRHCSISLSGGVDSSLLFALAATQGIAPIGYSMVDSSSATFDESYVIQKLHKSLGSTGYSYCIGGPQRWRQIQERTPYPDFGPLFHPELAYHVPFLEFVSGTMEARGHTPVLVAGVGADQIFGCQSLELKLWRARSRNAQVALHGMSALPMKHKLKTILQRSGLHKIGVRPFFINSSADADAIPALDIKQVTFFSREQWLQQRANQFREWAWEHTVRLLEIYRRSTGVLYLLPFATPKLCRFSSSLAPDQLRDTRLTKRLLRELLRGRIPDSISERGKFGVFGDVVRTGLLEHFDSKRFLARHGFESSENEEIWQRLNTTARLTSDEFEKLAKQATWNLWRLISSHLWLDEVDRCA